MEFVHDDGGRAEAGYKGSANDCVCRAIAIVTEKPYLEVYDALFSGIIEYTGAHRDRAARRMKCGKGRRGTTPRNGVSSKVYRAYLESLGWKWFPTMGIGTGCQVHLADGELPSGRLVVRLSKHLTAVIDGVIHDTYDPQRCTILCENGVQRIAHRCVYGYFLPTLCSTRSRPARSGARTPATSTASCESSRPASPDGPTW